MAEKRQEPAFTVTDRRLFREDGELRDAAREEEERVKATAPAAATSAAMKENEGKQQEPKEQEAIEETASVHSAVTPFPEAGDAPPPPTAAEQKAQAEAYKKSSDALDSRVELSGRSAKEFEMTFERFMASLYMTAMLQLGLMHQQGEQPRVDIIGARQTIDTLALLAEKTKGNLSPVEENFLQNSLYEVRMAYVEVTNALARPPQPGVATGTMGR
jgi:hypothetical protein